VSEENISGRPNSFSYASEGGIVDLLGAIKVNYAIGVDVRRTYVRRASLHYLGSTWTGFAVIPVLDKQAPLCFQVAHGP